MSIHLVVTEIEYGVHDQLQYKHVKHSEQNTRMQFYDMLVDDFPNRNCRPKHPFLNKTNVFFKHLFQVKYKISMFLSININYITKLST